MFSPENYFFPSEYVSNRQRRNNRTRVAAIFVAFGAGSELLSQATGYKPLETAWVIPSIGCAIGFFGGALYYQARNLVLRSKDRILYQATESSYNQHTKD